MSIVSLDGTTIFPKSSSTWRCFTTLSTNLTASRCFIILRPLVKRISCFQRIKLRFGTDILYETLFIDSPLRIYIAYSLHETPWLLFTSVCSVYNVHVDIVLLLFSNEVHFLLLGILLSPKSTIQPVEKDTIDSFLASCT